MSYSPSFPSLPPPDFPTRLNPLFPFSVLSSCPDYCPTSCLRPRHRLLSILVSFSASRYSMPSERYLHSPLYELRIRRLSYERVFATHPETRKLLVVSARFLQIQVILALIAIQNGENVGMSIEKACSEAAFCRPITLTVSRYWVKNPAIVFCFGTPFGRCDCKDMGSFLTLTKI